MARIDNLESRVHGRSRDIENMEWSNRQAGARFVSDGSVKNRSDRNYQAGKADEGRFGVMYEPMHLGRGIGVPNAQWTGCVTAIAVSMLDSGMVDAVVCIATSESVASEGNSGRNIAAWSEPEPILARTVSDVMKGRGVKPALAPSLKLLDEIKNDKSIKKLLFCGVGCAVQAFRVVQDDLGLEEVYVLGTNCVDNSPTPEAARKFIREGLQLDETRVQGYEFMQDFKVHVKFQSREATRKGNRSAADSGEEVKYVKKPYFTLPGTIAREAIADSCLACFDYTNALADVVVGYMAAPLDNTGVMDKALQSITIRNYRGSRMLQTALNAGRISLEKDVNGSGSHEKISVATVNSDSIVLGMVGGKVAEKGMPPLVGEVMALVMRGLGPKGINFARYSIDYHILRNYLHVLDEWGEERSRNMLPNFALQIVDHYMASDESLASLKGKLLTKRLLAVSSESTPS